MIEVKIDGRREHSEGRLNCDECKNDENNQKTAKPWMFQRTPTMRKLHWRMFVQLVGDHQNTRIKYLFYLSYFCNSFIMNCIQKSPLNKI